MSNLAPIRIAILASGSGTNAQAIIERIREGSLNAKVSMLIANNPGAFVLERAEQAQIPAKLIDHRAYASREEHEKAVLEALEASGCEYVVLAGYMRILSPFFLKSWQGKVLNIHPALLPAFPGAHAVADALAYGVKLLGPTVHFVTEQMDAGPIIIQAAFPTSDEETTLALLHGLEHRIYPQAIQWLAEKRLRLKNGRVVLKEAKKPLARLPEGVVISPTLEEGF